jgi:hypothetical protein
MLRIAAAALARSQRHKDEELPVVLLFHFSHRSFALTRQR